MDGKLKKSFQIFRLILTFADFGPPKLMFILFLYALSMLTVSHFLSLTRNGGYELSKEWWVIVASCAISIEIINQASYSLAKTNRKLAIKLKAVVFWLIFTGGVAAYIYLLSGLEKNPTWSWKWSEQIGYTLIYFALSWVLPFYSISTDIRFLLLYGKYTKFGGKLRAG